MYIRVGGLLRGDMSKASSHAGDIRSLGDANADQRKGLSAIM